MKTEFWRDHVVMLNFHIKGQPFWMDSLIQVIKWSDSIWCSSNSKEYCLANSKDLHIWNLWELTVTITWNSIHNMESFYNLDESSKLMDVNFSLHFSNTPWPNSVLFLYFEILNFSKKSNYFNGTQLQHISKNNFW